MIEMKENNMMGWNLEYSYTQLDYNFYSKVNPTPVRKPEIVVLNHSLADTLGLDASALNMEGAKVLGGNQILEGSVPIAQAYAGHQFGYFTMLGDGRAILLGEQITPSGMRYDIQLKGSGITPYSRRGDGRAALGPMLREYIISEAMYALGINTTRSLAVVTTGEPVYRETVLPGAVLTRIASSHIRVGTFQYISKWGTKEQLKELADYTIQRHYPEAKAEENSYLSFLKHVVQRQAALIAKWMLVGFIHGVMNTDNMAISGETIDYGPCAFMDTYNPATVFSSIDKQGRYAYGNQPTIGAWNLTRFAETLIPLLDDNIDKAVGLATEAISEFSKLYDNIWMEGMSKKLGLFTPEPEDKDLIEELLFMMQSHQVDYTNTFRDLTFVRDANTAFYDMEQYTDWKEKWLARLSKQQKTKEEIHQLMKNSNPAIIPRNHRVEEALDAAVKSGDYSVMHRLLEVLLYPFGHTPNQVEYSKLPEVENQAYRTFCGT